MPYHATTPPRSAESGREIRDGLDAEILAVGEPPIPTVEQPWSFRACSSEGNDLDLVHTWMNAPHVAEFWEQDWSRDRWQEALAKQWAGTYSRPMVVELDGTPFAYVELYRAARDVISRHYPARPHDIGYHVAIGDK